VRGWVHRLAPGIALSCLSGCGGSNSSTPAPAAAPPPALATIQQPTTVNLYPSTSPSDGARLFIKVTAVGTTAVAMPLAFDTGSAGITLYAPDIFPSSMVSSGGFTFAAGQTSISYQGITVTNQSGTRKYGSVATGRTQTGNIGFARVTFGDSGGELVTAVMPVFLYYLITDNSTGQSVPVPNQRGWFGVNDAANLIAIAGSTQPAMGYPACTPQTNGSCYVAGVFKYLSYAAGVNAGFMVSPSPLQSCEISTLGSCAPSQSLTIGLNGSVETGFSEVKLNCPPSNFSGPDNIDGYAVCQMGISDTTVTVSGAASGVLAGTVLFDSGTPSMVLNVPTGAAFPASVSPGSSVMVATPSGFTFGYTGGSGSEVTNTIVQPDSTAESIVGIGYFTTNAFFIDFTAATEGWK
jgi:hypothetical protein